MTDGITAIIFPVADLSAAKTLYGGLLGVEPEMDQPYYVGYRIGGLDIGLDPNGHRQGMTGPIAYWTVADMEATVNALVDAGREIQGAAKDVGGGKLIATVKDADGNVVGLIQPA
jgi:predicted enzyme related to lactoylglutathione lyase